MNHYAATGDRRRLRRVEECLLHLELASIDFQQVCQRIFENILIF